MVRHKQEAIEVRRLVHGLSCTVPVDLMDSHTDQADDIANAAETAVDAFADDPMFHYVRDVPVSGSQTFHATESQLKVLSRAAKSQTMSLGRMRSDGGSHSLKVGRALGRATRSITVMLSA